MEVIKKRWTYQCLYEELRKIVAGNKEALEIVEELEKLGIDDKYNAYYDA